MKPTIRLTPKEFFSRYLYLTIAVWAIVGFYQATMPRAFHFIITILVWLWWAITVPQVILSIFIGIGYLRYKAWRKPRQ